MAAEGECLPERGWGLGAGGWRSHPEHLVHNPLDGHPPLIPQPLHFWESRLANAPQPHTCKHTQPRPLLPGGKVGSAWLPALQTQLETGQDAREIQPVAASDQAQGGDQPEASSRG